MAPEAGNQTLAIPPAGGEPVDWSTQPQAGWASFVALREIAIAAMTSPAGAGAPTGTGGPR